MYRGTITTFIIMTAIATAAYLSLYQARNVFAVGATSTNYAIEFDSVNSGGTDFSTSTNYELSDTVGEIATGKSTSTNYQIYAGYRQMDSVQIALTAAADVTMSPDIGGVSGGTSNGSTSFTVTTDSHAGYEVQIKASSSPALQRDGGGGSFNDYTPGGDPDFAFSVAENTSEFAFTPEGTDIADEYKDNGSNTCNTGSTDTADACWDGLSTSNQTIVQRTSANQPNGTLTTLKFRAKSGSNHIQIDGTYTATTTITALPL